MLNRLFRSAERRARNRAPETKSSPLIALQLAAAAQWTPRNYACLAREGVMQNPVVYRCVRMIAEGAASVPFLLYDGDSELAAHPLLALLAAPNAQDSGTALFERWYAFLQCAGNAYLQAIALGGDIRELYVLRPDRMKVVEGAAGWPAAYEYSVNGRTLRIARDVSGFLPVLHGTLFHPLDDYYGLSPIEAAARAIDVHNEGAAWAKSLLDNAARPSGALIYRGPDGAPNLTDDQFNRLKTELESGYQGALNAGRPMVLEGGLQWQSMSHSPADLDFANTRDVAAREIALAFGVPPMLLGIPGDNTYSNYQEAYRIFFRGTVLPLACRIGSALTHWLTPAFGDGIRLTVDTDNVPALAKDRAAFWDQVGKAAFLTVNEKREAIGFSPIEGGDRL
jgi:HK97 family phage portal protein